MSSTALAAIGWVVAGAVIGVAVGWFATRRALRKHRQRDQERLRLELQKRDKQTATLTTELSQATKRLTEFEATVPELEAQATEQDRALERIQAQILDRESTITSLRSRLYGSRTAAALIEEKLEAREDELVELKRRLAKGDAQKETQRSEPIATSSSASTLTVDLGSGLSIETNPKESHSLDGG